MCYNGAMQLNSSSSTVKVNLSDGIMHNALSESERIGISLQDFIRMLLGTYFAKSTSIQSISRDQVLFDNALQDIEAQKFTRVKNQRELDNYLDSL